MDELLRVLLLEDSDEDATLVTRALQKTLPTCEIRRVDLRPEFEAALHSYRPHLILSDHRLQNFSGMHALEVVRSVSPETPFVFVTGSLDEETAAECVKAGAWDYVIKDRLIRLGSVVSSVLELRRTRDALRRSEEQLRHTQKMDALGRLAGGVAHDFNNVITAVLGYTHLLSTTFAPEDERRADLDEIRRAAERAVGLTGQLLAFSRKQVIALAPMDVNDAITNVRQMLKTLAGERVELVLDLAPNLPRIQSETGQFEQVIVNLAVNARDAMPNGGTLTIRTTRGPDPDGRVLVDVQDTGTGMEPALLERVFEPFFTTKARGRGTGLGLSTVYGIVRHCGGQITATSEVGRGTTFTLSFPLSTDVSLEGHAGGSTAPVSLAGTETVLIAEDDPTVRSLARRVLGSYGYRVHEAENVASALQMATRESGVDLLLTDIMMPDGTGVDLARAVRQQWPGTSVVYMSGYTDDELARQEVSMQDAPYIQKPFTPVSLVERVREALDKRGKSSEHAA